MSRLRIVAPLPPNIANSRLHWATKLRAKKAYWRECEMWMHAGRIPKLEEPRPDRQHMTVKLYLHNAMDADNAAARLKWLLDWLVGNGYMAGDSAKDLEWTGMPDLVIDRPNPRVEITLTPA